MHWMHPRVTMKCCLVCVCSTHSAIILVGLWLVFSLTVIRRGSMADWSDIQLCGEGFDPGKITIVSVTQHCNSGFVVLSGFSRFFLPNKLLGAKFKTVNHGWGWLHCMRSICKYLALAVACSQALDISHGHRLITSVLRHLLNHCAQFTAIWYINNLMWHVYFAGIDQSLLDSIQFTTNKSLTKEKYNILLVDKIIDILIASCSTSKQIWLYQWVYKTAT